MTIDQIIEAIKSGVSDEELGSMLEELRQSDPGALRALRQEDSDVGVKVRDELSETQVGQLEMANSEFFVDSPFDFSNPETAQAVDMVAGLVGGGRPVVAGASLIGRGLLKTLKFGRKHPIATSLAAGGAGIPIVAGLDETARPGEGTTPTTTPAAPSLGNLGVPTQLSPGHPRGGRPPGSNPNQQDQNPNVLPPDSGFNIMVVDHDGRLTGTPGAVAVVTSAEMGITPDPGLQQFISDQILTSGGQGDALSFLTDYLSGSNPGAVAGTQGREVVQALFPETLGSVTIDSPFQVVPTTTARTGRSTPTPITGESVSLSEPMPDSFMPGMPRAIREQEWQDRQRSQQPTQEATTVPAGAQISPRIFNQYKGRTLMEWAQISAQRHGIPLNILYGIVDHESRWNTAAVGDNGNSFGLAQIFLPAWGGSVSKYQALNPIFALEWTAQKLRDRFQQYGRWDAAVAAHNSPAAAAYLAKTGKFQNEKSASYTKDVLDRANRSGLADYLFDEGDTVETDSPGPTGPTYTPFQEPDPAASREYIRSVYEELLGREPNEDELSKGVGKISGLARSAYNANLRQAKGGESEAVDIEAQFTEGIRETGEFQFHEEVTDQRSFTDFAAGVARLLQQGA